MKAICHSRQAMLGYSLSNFIAAPEHSACCLVGGTLYTSDGVCVKSFHIASDTTKTFITGLSERIKDMTLSRCKKLLLVVGETSGVFLDALNGTCINRFRCQGNICAVAFSYSTKYLAIAIDKSLEVWDLHFTNTGLAASLRRRHVLSSSHVTRISWSEDDRYIVIGSSDQGCHLIALTNDFQCTDILAGASAVVDVRVFSKPKKVVALLADGTLITAFFDENEAATQMHLELTSSISCASFNSDMSMVCIGTNGGFEVREAPDWGIRTVMGAHISNSSVLRCICDPLMNHALTHSSDGEICVWNWQTGDLSYKTKKLSVASTSALTSDGSVLVTGSTSGSLSVWNLPSGACSMTFTQHSARVTALVFLTGDAAFVSASLDGTIRAFDMGRYKNFRTLVAPDRLGITHIAIDRSNQFVCGATECSHKIFVWSISTGQLVESLVGHDAPVTALCISPHSSNIFSSSWDKTVRVWDIYDKKQQLDSFIHSSEVTTAALSLNGRLLATVTSNGQMHLWCTHTKVLHGSMHIPALSLGSGVRCIGLHFIHNDSALISVSSSCVCDIFDTSTFSQIRRHNFDYVLSNRRVGSKVSDLASCTSNGQNLVVVSLDSVYLFVSQRAPLPIMLGENVSELSIRHAMKGGQYSKALELSILLAKPSMFTAVLHTAPMDQVRKFIRHMNPNICKHTLQLLNYALSSLHVERVLSALREVCLSPTVKLGDCRSVLSNISLDVNGIRSSATSSAESNIDLLDFICSSPSREVP